MADILHNLLFIHHHLPFARMPLLLARIMHTLRSSVGAISLSQTHISRQALPFGNCYQLFDLSQASAYNLPTAYPTGGNHQTFDRGLR